MFSPFDYPEVQKLFKDLLTSLLEESGRGAILIGATSVEEHLTKLIEDTLPMKGEKYKKRLLKYPGALSSFSAKIELAFAFRLINENLYNSLNSLRELRNKAAHSSQLFSLPDLENELDKIFNLGPSIPVYVRNQGTKMMMDLKLKSLDELFDKENYTNDQRKESIEGIMKNVDLLKEIDNQAPHWALIYGLSMICGFLSYERENVLKALNGNITWGSLAENKK